MFRLKPSTPPRSFRRILISTMISISITRWVLHVVAPDHFGSENFFGVVNIVATLGFAAIVAVTRWLYTRPRTNADGLSPDNSTPR